MRGDSIAMIFFLIRHGESLFNAQKRIQGQLDVALTPLGRKQAAALAIALGSLDLDAIYSSPLIRAMQTAEPIAAAARLTIQTDDRLKEINAGVFEGVNWDEIDRRAPEAAIKWREHDPDFVIPGGESRRAVGARGRAALEAIRAAGHRRVAVIAHGGVLSGALKSIVGVETDNNPFSFYNASITRLAWGARIKLLTLNELDHLRAAGLPLPDSTGDL